MSTERRINASRLNGARSSGPSTEEGKEKSARNAIRHGMLSQSVVLLGESTERFQALLQAFTAEFSPETEAETALVENMSVARWRQMRVWGIEKSSFDREMLQQDPALGPPSVRAAIVFKNLSDGSRALDNIHRYETSYERQFNRALRELRRLQEKPATIGTECVPYFPPNEGTCTWNEAEQENCKPSDAILPNEPNPKTDQLP